MSRMDDGHQTLITSSLHPDVLFWERTVTPPGMDQGGGTRITNMHNVAWETFRPKHLKTLTEAGGTVLWDPEAYDEVQEMMGENALWTCTFPDESSVDFWGWLDKFTPGQHQIGEPPEATLSIFPSNLDDSDNEVGPVYNAP